MVDQIWTTSGPGAVTIVSDTAVNITGAGGSPTTARKVFSTESGNRYRICWTADSTDAGNENWFCWFCWFCWFWWFADRAVGTFRVGRSAVRWQQPVLTDPTIVDLNTVAPGKKVWTFRPTEDVLFLPKSTPWLHDRLQTIGGRNIVLIGGKFAPDNFSSPVGTLNFTRNHGTVYVEGVHIDHAGVGEKDGVGYYHEPGAPDGDFIMQNTLIENIKGSFAGIHGDSFQPQGSIKNFRAYNVSTTTQYQAFILEPRIERGFSIGTATMERVEAAKLPGPDLRSWLYYFTETNTPVYPIILKDVYVTEAPGLPAESNFVYPPKGVPAGAIRFGNKIAWPEKPYYGWITVGTRGFVTAAQCGIGYTRNEPVICKEAFRFFKGKNAIEFTAISDKTYFELMRTNPGTIKITGVIIKKIKRPWFWNLRCRYFCHTRRSC
jgi:hypothetical protein